MNSEYDPIAGEIASLARSTLAAVPAPKPFVVIRILAERRHAEMAAHRVLVLLTLASLAPTAVVLAAWALSPDPSAAARMAGAFLTLTLIPSIAAVARAAGMRRPANTWRLLETRRAAAGCNLFMNRRRM
jgi:hypothetical protein